MSEGSAQSEAGGSEPALSQALLLSVAEELKLPLLQIARRAEYAQRSGEANLEGIQETAETALRLIDNYALGVRLAQNPQMFDAEPVSVSAVLYDTGQDLSDMARGYGVELELHVAGRYGTVMANHQGLQSALTSLGMALIEALPAQGTSQLKLQLATHRSRYGIVAGLYTDMPQLSSTVLERGKKLQGRSRQPFTTLSHANGAGIFVADTILHAMRLRLHASRHHHLYGLGIVLPPNNQLELV